MNLEDISNKRKSMSEALDRLLTKQIELQAAIWPIAYEIGKLQAVACNVKDAMDILLQFISGTKEQWLRENGIPSVVPKCLVCASPLEPIKLTDEEGNLLPFVDNLEDYLTSYYSNYECPVCGQVTDSQEV